MLMLAESDKLQSVQSDSFFHVTSLPLFFFFLSIENDSLVLNVGLFWASVGFRSTSLHF